MTRVTDKNAQTLTTRDMTLEEIRDLAVTTVPFRSELPAHARNLPSVGSALVEADDCLASWQTAPFNIRPGSGC